jgi:hypothetical protein
MKFNRRSLILLISLGILSLSGCNLPNSSSDPGAGFAVVINSPSTSITVAPLAPYLLAAHSEGTNIVPVHISFYVNNQMIGAVDTSLGAQAALKWTPPAIGDYAIQAQAQAQNGQVIVKSAVVQMCILNIDTSQGNILWGYGYLGSCTTPPESASTEAVTIGAIAKPASLSYAWNTCPSEFTTSHTIIYFQAKVGDPANRVAFVNIKYIGNGWNFHFAPNSNVSDGLFTDTLFDAVFLNQTSVGSDGTKVYTGQTMDLGEPAASALAGGAGTIQWWARALDGNGKLLAEDGPHTIPIASCNPPIATFVQPTLTATLVPTKTSVPTLVPIVLPTTIKHAGGKTPKPPTPVGPTCPSTPPACGAQKQGCPCTNKP